MSSSEGEDTNPKAKGTNYPPAKPKVEETTELENDQDDDEEEEQNIKEGSDAISKQFTGVSVQVRNPQLKDGGAFSKKFTDYEVAGNDKHG